MYKTDVRNFGGSTVVLSDMHLAAIVWGQVEACTTHVFHLLKEAKVQV